MQNFHTRHQDIMAVAYGRALPVLVGGPSRECEHFWWVHGANTFQWEHQSEAAGPVPTPPLALQVSTPGLWQPSACLWAACKASKLLCIVLQTLEKHSQALLWLHKGSEVSASVTCGKRSAWGCEEMESETCFLQMNAFSLFQELSVILTQDHQWPVNTFSKRLLLERIFYV